MKAMRMTMITLLPTMALLMAAPASAQESWDDDSHYAACEPSDEDVGCTYLRPEDEVCDGEGDGEPAGNQSGQDQEGPGFAECQEACAYMGADPLMFASCGEEAVSHFVQSCSEACCEAESRPMLIAAANLPGIVVLPVLIQAFEMVDECPAANH